MNPEIMIIKGQLAEANKKMRIKEVEAHGLVLLLRQIINPYIDVTSLKTEEIAQAAKRLHELSCKIAELKNTISDMEEGLG